MSKDRLEEGRWKLDKYARYLLLDKPQASASQSSDTQGEWKMYDSKEDVLYISLLTTSHLLVTHGNNIMEDYSLLGAQSWMRVVRKGDSLLFLCKLRDENRRFRIKFASDGCSGSDHCGELVKRITHYVTVKNTMEEAPTEDTQEQPDPPPPRLPSITDLESVAKVTCKLDAADLPLAYTQTNIPTEHLGPLIRLCLADPNFPAFVGEVEKELNKLTQS